MALVWYTIPHKRGTRRRRVHKRQDCYWLTTAKEVKTIRPGDAKRLPRCRWCFSDEEADATKAVPQ